MAQDEAVATGVAGAGAARLFGGVARLRRDRALHPHGVTAHGTLRAHGSAAGRGSRLLSKGGEHPAIVRLSRGGGLPEPLPDVLGCALRVPDAYGRGRHQDLALASSLARPVGRHLLVPALSFAAAFYSSLLLYAIGSRSRMFGARLEPASGRGGGGGLDAMARAVEGGGLEVTLSVAPTTGEWEPVATLRLDRLADAEEARIRFNVWNSGGGIRPTGFLQRLRDPAYRGSQAASPGAD